MENMHFLDTPTPIYGDNMDVIPSYVGYGTGGWLLGQNRSEEAKGSNPARSTGFHPSGAFT
jgi:hypothetical protein